MIEQIIPAVVAIVTGGGFLINRVHHRITELDRRVDKLELMVLLSMYLEMRQTEYGSA